MSTNRSNCSIDPETASEGDMIAEIARLLMMRRILKQRRQQKTLFARIRELEAARERRFDVPAPDRTMRARA